MTTSPASNAEGARSRRQSAKGAKRREKIVAAAFATLSRDGYSKASLGQIGRAIGMESGHILYYFSSREQLLEEVLRRWDREIGVVPVPGQDVFEMWLAAVRENIRNPGIVHLYMAFAAEAADPGHAAHAFFLERFSLLEERIAAEIRERQSAGLTDPEVDPRRTAAQLISLSDGLQLRWLSDREFDMLGALEFGLRSMIGYRVPTGQDAAPTSDTS
jgi:AcrR family transcriptional regulator